VSGFLGAHDFGFGSPGFLWALIILPVLFGVAAVLRRRRSRYAVAYTNLDLLASVVQEKQHPWRRRLPLALLALALALALAALARPHASLESTDQGSTVILLVDVSGSMQATDIPPSRLQASVAAMLSFLDRLPKNTRVGLIAVSDQAEVLAPPTTDHTRVAAGLDVLTPQGGTALGIGVDEAVKVIVSVLAGSGVHPRPGHYLPAAIVLATDGGQDRGTIGIQSAGLYAKQAGIRIYGVTVGTPQGVITRGAGLVAQEYAVPVDPGTQALLARLTGGQSFIAADSTSLNSIFHHLGSTVAYRYQVTQIASWFEIAAATVLVVAFGALRLQGSALL
jgi:Ca-activated chloride channel homolog